MSSRLAIVRQGAAVIALAGGFLLVLGSFTTAISISGPCVSGVVPSVCGSGAIGLSASSTFSWWTIPISSTGFNGLVGGAGYLFAVAGGLALVWALSALVVHRNPSGVLVLGAFSWFAALFALLVGWTQLNEAGANLAAGGCLTEYSCQMADGPAVAWVVASGLVTMAAIVAGTWCAIAEYKVVDATLGAEERELPPEAVAPPGLLAYADEMAEFSAVGYTGPVPGPPTATTGATPTAVRHPVPTTPVVDGGPPVPMHGELGAYPSHEAWAAMSATDQEAWVKAVAQQTSAQMRAQHDASSPPPSAVAAAPFHPPPGPPTRGPFNSYPPPGNWDAMSPTEREAWVRQIAAHSSAQHRAQQPTAPTEPPKDA